MIRKLLSVVATWFESAPPVRSASRAQVLVLALLVVAGGAVRLWELGDVGLHGDEETMAMPTMHIVEHGTPHLPSGMFYPRALGQLYLMAGSVQLFGESEWAFRLPSALTGTLLIVLAWFLGRRFLEPAWNLVFVACVAFLPAFIVDAQTARMYVFLVASLAVMSILIFRWERTGRATALLGAFLALLVALQFHSLAVFGSLLFLFPGLLHGERRQFFAGVAAFVGGLVGYHLIDGWVMSHYPPQSAAEFPEMTAGPKAGWALPQLEAWMMLPAALVAAALAWSVARRLDRRPLALAIAAALACGLLAQFAFFYHAAALLLIAGGVAAFRASAAARRPLLLVAAVSAMLVVAHVALLQARGVESPRQLLGALVGQPSVWPYLIFAQYSIGAALAAAAAFVAALVLLARRRRAPDFVLFFVLGVWLPLLAIGLFKWYVPLRYTAGQTLPLLLAACAAAQWVAARWLFRQSVTRVRLAPAQVLAASLAALAFVNPPVLSRTVGAGYGMHPDHKGAAEFIRRQHLAPSDLVIAEDVLQQTYYLGRVDYWLVAGYVAAQFTREVNGEPRDIYTASPAITSGEELAALLARRDRGAIYVIGSGEEQSDGRRHARGPGIHALLQSPDFRVVYEGRDGFTKVWKVPAASAADETTLEANASRPKTSTR